MSILSILLTFLILGMIVFVHELGHFLTAKYFKMPVSEFALGFGPKLLSKKHKDTTYSIRLLPIGGFVNIEGMELDSDIQDGFSKKKPLARFIVLVAGVVMNFILGWLIFFCFYLFFGETVIEKVEPVVGDVATVSHAYKVLKPEDRISKIDGKTINDWDELQSVLKEKREPKVLLEIIRSGQTINIETTMYLDRENNYKIGISPSSKHVKNKNIRYGIKDSTIKATEMFGNSFVMTFVGLKKLMSGEAQVKEMVGPIRTPKVVEIFMQYGIDKVVLLAGLFSVCVGAINLIPLPALDGGRILFVFLEMIGIRVNKNWEENLHRVGFILLMFLMLAVVFIDIRYFNDLGALGK